VLVNDPESILSSILTPLETASASWQSSFDPYHLSNDNGDHLMADNLTEETASGNDRIPLQFLTSFL